MNSLSIWKDEIKKKVLAKSKKRALLVVGEHNTLTGKQLQDMGKYVTWDDHFKYNDPFSDCNRSYTDGFDNARREDDRREERREEDRREEQRQERRRYARESEEEEYYRAYEQQEEPPAQEPPHYEPEDGLPF